MNELYLEYAQRVDQIVSERTKITLLRPLNQDVRDYYDHNITAETAAENIMIQYDLI